MCVGGCGWVGVHICMYACVCACVCKRGGGGEVGVHTSEVG